MIRYESSVTIACPPAEVFRYLVEPEKQRLWSDVPMRQLTPGDMATGSRMEVTFGMGPLKAVLGLEVTDLEPGSRMAFKTYSGPIKWQGEYRLAAAADGGSTLSQEGTLAFTGLWRLFQPLAGAEIKSGEIKELERLKQVIEGA